MKQSSTTPRAPRVAAAAAACIALVAAACERPTMPKLTPEDPTNATTAAAPGPTLLSETTWGGPGSDVTEGAAVASDGSTYLVGFTSSFGGGASKVFVVKLAPDGSLAWQRTWDAPADALPFVNDEARDVAVASDGSVYVTGTTFVGGNGALLLKLNSDGSLQWQRVWGGNAHGQEVAVAADGSVFVTGATRSSDGGADLFVTKFSPDGTLLWFKTWGTAGTHEEGQGVAVGPDGNVYVAGVATRGGDPSLFAFDAVVLKLDPAGSVIWQRAYAGGDVADARGGIAVGADGSVYVAGGYQLAANKVVNDALLLSVTPEDGSLVWDRRWGGESGDFAEAVAVAPDGRVVFVGATNSYGQGSDDAFVLRLEPGGRTSDASTWGSVGLDNGKGVGIAPDGTVSLGATTEAPPYVLEGARARTSRARLSVTTPTLVLVDAPGVASDPNGIVETPAGSTTYAGSFDAALVRLAP